MQKKTKPRRKMNTCFICLEDGEADGSDVYRVCACDTRVHAECFRKLVEQVPAHRESCPVCKTKYAVCVRRRIRFCDEPRFVLSQCLGLFLTMSIIGSTSYFWLLSETTAKAFTVTFSVCIFVLLIFLAGKVMCSGIRVVETRTLVLQ